MSADSRRPARFCEGLLAALDASEGRRRRRKRDTTPDAVGLAIKRDLLEAALRDDPDPDEFEGWLLRYCLDAGGDTSVGATRMMALDVLAEWRLVQAAPDFLDWLARGAPSEDHFHAASETERAAERPPAA
jgi:hypothetical protein